jgi:hypothetical protein
MPSWAAEELKYANLPDKRLNKRLITIVKNLASQPSASSPQASGDWANTKATYNFWDSERIESEDIIDAHRRKTAERASSEKVILAIQDTSDFNFTHHKSKTWDKGFGQTCSQAYVRGLKVHSTMASSTQGVPLGVLDLQIWTRKPQGKSKKPKKAIARSIKLKESKRWLTGLISTELAIPSDTTVVTITDREGDIYELFALEREANSELLIRAKHNRCIEDELKYLQAGSAKIPSSGTVEVLIPKQEGKPARTARLTIRYSSFTILPPKSYRSYRQAQAITLNVVFALEENPPASVKAIDWLLLTTLDVNTWADAVRCIRWYTYRWLIERYHYVLKSGCRIEHLQLETADRLKKALATYAIVAWRLLWLTYSSREHPDILCDTVLESHEWQSLYCHIHASSIPPLTPPSLQQAVLWIAQLGGFLGRKLDGFPGVKTLWKGWQRLQDIAFTWKLGHCSPASHSYG